ncbi:MAG: T9SS type A sorting domain-containing protein, partial [Ignavibacteria bacterium]|nr:T9SS type A sorting domain-containing protein [Ignavibacteria bacterium]
TNGYVGGFSMSNDTSLSSIEYYANVPYDAYYHLYVYIIPNYINSTQARYTVYHQNDSTVVFVDQSKTQNAGWYKLGDFFLTKGNKKILKLDNSTSFGKYIVADAVLLLLNRKLSPNLVITNAKEEFASQEKIQFKNKIEVYPNPFNSETRIKFFLDKPSNVELKLFDLLGREVFKTNKECFNAGEFYFTIDGNELQLASGIYFGLINNGHNYKTFKLNYLK